MEKEKELVKKFRRGDTQAFGVLYDQYVKRIYNFIFYKTFSKETAEDLTSQTFYKALKNITSFDEARAFSSWLYTIAYNSVIDHYRRSRNTVDIDDVWDLTDDTDIVKETETKLEFTKVEKYLRELASHERDIIMLRIWQELTYKEVAEITGKSEASCKMVYSRAIRKLRDAAEADGAQSPS
jgi:RNA polymerase sigma-70 factor, ECF subfamily